MIRHMNGPASLSAVSLRSLRAYLEAQGWRSIEKYGDSALIYGLEGKTEELLVPLAPLADYDRRMADLLETLSAVEQRDDNAILRDVSLTDFDLIRVRLPEVSADGSIPVSTGLTLFQESRNLLLSAACSASRPQRAYRAGGNKQATDYMSSVRFGQTEAGSFTVNLLSPVPPPLIRQGDLITGGYENPYPRRVTSILVSGLKSIDEAVASVNGGDDIEAFDKKVPKGVSANLCDAIANLLECENQKSFDVSVSWSPIRRGPEGRSRVQFVTPDAKILREASYILKNRQERPNERLEGNITSLARGQAQRQGRAILKAMVDGIMSSVRVDFTPQDYSRITEAHDHRRVVSLEGDLYREGQRWVLQSPRDLVVELEEDDD